MVRLVKLTQGLVLGCSITFAQANAADWSAIVSISENLRFQNNPTLSTTDKEDNLMNTLTPSVTGVFETENLKTDFKFGLDIVHATNEVVQNNYVGYDAAIENDYAYENGIWEFDYGLSVDSVLNTEFEDTNIYVSDVKRTNNDVSFSGKHDISELSKINFSQSYNNTDYDGGTYVPYENLESKLGWETDLSETTTLTTDIGFDLYMPQGRDNTKTYRYNIGAKMSLSESATLNIDTGIRRNSSEMGWTQAIDYSDQWERLNTTAGFSYDQTPSGTGQLRKNLTFNFGGTYELAEDWTASANARYNVSSQSGSNSGGSSYNWNVAPNLSYTINEAWSTGITYTERHRKASGSDEWAVSREGLYYLNYNFQYR
jgi:hypothetical protein